jgi:hypothetical protein
MYVSYSVNDSKKEDAIRVIIPRDLHIGDENFEKIEIGERVKVQIKKSRFQINDPYILSVGVLLGSVAKGTPATATGPAPTSEDEEVVPAPAPEDEEEEAVEEEAVEEEVVEEDDAVFDEETAVPREGDEEAK